MKNSLLRRREEHRFGAKVRNTEVPAPLFVLGHWRNGTTHLHNLLCIDRRFAFPNTYQVCFPHTFLSTEAKTSRRMAFFLPKHRPMDNVEWNFGSPQEDEFALCVASRMSPCMSWVFPRRRARFEKYLTFREVAAGDLGEWKAAFEVFLKKLTLRHGRPLILKSPPHTGRLRILLGLFPDAKFVHIRRNPYVVFQSSKRAFQVNCDWNGLQIPRPNDFDDWVLRQYKEMYDAFFEERGLLRERQLCEIAFEGLEADPVGQVKNVYDALDLPDFRVVQPELAQYVASVAGYEKNAFQELPPELRSRIAKEWSHSFREWGYPL